MNYTQVAPTVVVAGFLVRGRGSGSKANVKQHRKNPNAIISAHQLERFRNHLGEKLAVEVGERDATVKSFRSDPAFHEELVRSLNADIKSSTGQFHDYRQLAARVIQNISVIWARRYSGIDTEDAASRAPHEEAAIYYTARLMTEKLDAALLLINPDALRRLEGQTVFRLHGYVSKYVKLYQRAFDDRGLQLDLAGESYGQVRGHADAVGALIQALIDNALKYAPARSRVNVHLLDGAHDIDLSVESLGPKIDPDEFELIFAPYVRGRHAGLVSAEGTGFGLAAARLVASAMGGKLTCAQESEAVQSRYFLTRFVAALPRDLERPTDVRARQRQTNSS